MSASSAPGLSWDVLGLSWDARTVLGLPRTVLELPRTVLELRRTVLGRPRDPQARESDTIFPRRGTRNVSDVVYVISSRRHMQNTYF